MISAALILAGCSTTQETAARLQLNDYREIASQNATIVRRPNAAVGVTGVSLVRGTERSSTTSAAVVDAYVVSIHNAADHAVSDLPISVGYTRHGSTRRVYANGSDTVSYFEAHLGLIAAHTTVTWIYTAPAPPVGATPFALVGADAPADISAAPAASLADWRFTLTLGAPDAGVSLELRVTNHTPVPQYGLPVYVYALRAGRPVGAGTAVVSTLNPGDTARVRVALVGNVEGGQLHAEVLPADAR